MGGCSRTVTGMPSVRPTISEAAAEFSARGAYCNTASIGLPPRRSLEALALAYEAWRVGDAEPADYDAAVGSARGHFATLSGTTPARVAIASQLSTCAGLVASALAPGDEVLCAEGDFTSLLFPFLADPRGLAVRTVPLERLIDSIRPATRLVAVSAVQSADGRVLDLSALAEAATAHDALTFVDTTHAVGWMPVQSERFSATACAAYKWLCSPRGVAFMTVHPDSMGLIAPRNANWYAGEEPWNSLYGPPLRLAQDARRYDHSPAWLSFAGAAPALELLCAVGIEAIRKHDLALANALRERLGLAPSNSAIVSLQRENGEQALRAAGVRCAMRGGAIRVSFPLYNTLAAVEVVAGALAHRGGWAR